MQSLNLKLDAESSKNINIEANGFWYESGASALDNRIIVTPSGGSDVVLKAGQSVRIAQKVTGWTVRKFNNAATIDANLVLGTGEFSDNNANINGTMSVLGTVAIDTTAGRVKVEDTVLDSNKIIYNDVGSLFVQNFVAGNVNFYKTLITAAENTKGVLIQKLSFKKNAYNTKMLLCIVDAENQSWQTNKNIIEVFDFAGLAAGAVLTMEKERKVPAGKILSLQTDGGAVQYSDGVHSLMSILT